MGENYLVIKKIHIGKEKMWLKLRKNNGTYLFKFD